MQKIAKFEKVSFDRFQKDWLKAFPETEDVQAVFSCKRLCYNDMSC